MTSSLMSAAVHRCGKAWRAVNERWLDIVTTEDALFRSVPGLISERSHNDNYAYSTPDYLDLRRMLRRAQLGTSDVLYDIGCGMGRLLCLAARRRISKCIGIELHAGLAEIARRNAERLRKRIAPIEIRTQDAATADLSEGTIFYLFNPFGPDTLAAVLANLQRSFSERPRAVKIIYANPLHAKVLAATPWLVRYDELKTMRGMYMWYYRNTQTL